MRPASGLRRNQAILNASMTNCLVMRSPIAKPMESRGGYAMIPTRKNRKIQIPVDGYIYALRNQIERCFMR